MVKGGRREGAGRPKKFGAHHQSTKQIRVPENLVNDIYAFIADADIRIPLLSSLAPAGFASPADDYVEESFTPKELVDYFVQRPASTFLARISGWSMKSAGIMDGCMVICDRSLEPMHNDVVLASVDGMVTCKRLHLEDGRATLMPDTDMPEFRPIPVEDYNDLTIWGVVTGNFNVHRNAHATRNATLAPKVPVKVVTERHQFAQAPLPKRN